MIRRVMLPTEIADISAVAELKSISRPRVTVIGAWYNKKVLRRLHMAADITLTLTPEEAELVKKAIDHLQDACAAAAEADEWLHLEKAYKKIVEAEVDYVIEVSS